jgi:hypothetical protein
MIGKFSKETLLKFLTILKLLFFTRGKKVEMGLLNALLLSLIILISQFLDAVSTKVGLKVGGQEANGIMAQFIDSFGVEGFFIFKALVSLILAYFFWKRPVVTLVVASIYFLVVFNNLMVIYRNLG